MITHLHPPQGGVDHLHLGVGVVLLLMFVQGAVVPHEELEGGVQRSHVVRSPHPGPVRGETVSSVRIAGSHNEQVLRDGLKKWNSGKKIRPLIRRRCG